jgi:TPR repeat protein
LAPAPLQSGDLLLLDQESIIRVKAAARAGDLLAQSALGSAYLKGTGDLPRSVPEAVYWLRKVTDRDPAEFEHISTRMQVLLDNRLFEVDPQRQRETDLEYLNLATKRLAYESAFLEIVHVYLGGEGDAYANVLLALKYLRLGAAYGLPSSQRDLGIVTRFGWLGVPKNEIRAAALLNEAAAQGDRVAQRLLVELRYF